MYFLGLVVFMVFLVCSTLLSNSLASFIDLPSITITLAFSIPMLMASGLLPDFIRGFIIMGQKINTWSLFELKKTEIALQLMIKLLLFSGLFGSIIGLVSILSNFSGMSTIGPNLSLSILTFFYSVLIVFILLPIKAKVKAIILEFEKECSDEESIN